MVDEERPQGVITPAEYALHERAVKDKEAELRAQVELELEPLKRKLDTSVFIVE